MQNSKNSLRSIWWLFGKAILRPDFFFFLLISIVFVVLNIVLDRYFPTGSQFKYFLVAVFTLSTGYFSTKLFQVYEKVVDVDKDSVIKQKGITSIRTLSSVLTKLNSLKNYSGEILEQQGIDPVLSAKIYHMNNSIDFIMDDTKNSIRDWNDILPSIDNILKIKDRVDELIEEIKVLEKQGAGLNEENKLKEKDLEKLKVELDEKRKELRDTGNSLNRFQPEYLPLVTAPVSTINTGISSSPIFTVTPRAYDYISPITNSNFSVDGNPNSLKLR